MVLLDELRRLDNGASTPLPGDACLTAQHGSQGMTTCVSWAAGPELELDL